MWSVKVTVERSPGVGSVKVAMERSPGGGVSQGHRGEVTGVGSIY